MLSSVHKLKLNSLTEEIIMNIFETIPAYDYIIAVVGVLGVILGIAQLGAKGVSVL